MAVEPYDWQRDLGLDFPDDPRSEPDTGEVKDALYFTGHEYAGIEDNHAGMRNG